MSKFWIYVGGGAIGGAGYQLLKSSMPDPALFAALCAYAVVLRLLAEKLGK